MWFTHLLQTRGVQAEIASLENRGLQLGHAKMALGNPSDDLPNLEKRIDRKCWFDGAGEKDHRLKGDPLL